MTSAPALADPSSSPASMRAVADAFLRQTARASGREYNAHTMWAEFGLWVPAEESDRAAEELDDLFSECSPGAPAVVEVLWTQAAANAPVWWRTQIVEIGPDSKQPWMRVLFADPATCMMRLNDVAAVRRCLDELPLSCCESVKPSSLRPPPALEDLLPEVEISADEADSLINHYLHQEAHRVGPLWTTIDAQAAAARDRLVEVIRATAAGAVWTEVNAVAWAYDTGVPCPTHMYEPLPAYIADDDLTCGMRLVAHLHRDGTVGWEGSLEQMRAVLTVVALYGGSVHLATTAAGESPVTEEVTYQVFCDWRIERVEGPEVGR